jgi:transposase
MQRYKCKECGCQFTDSPQRGVDPALKTLAIVLYAYCGLSMSKIAKLCQVSIVAVLNWIKDAAPNVEPLTGASSSDIVMTCEMWHFVNGKKTKYGSGAQLMESRINLWDGNVVIVGIQP